MSASETTAIRDRLAEFLRDYEDKRLLTALSELKIDADEFENFFVGLTKESDRGLAIVAFSFIDEKLRALLLGACNAQIRGGPNRLFEAFGPLATASARIEISTALYWIDQETYNDLRILRKIRNRFAHYPFAASFDDPSVASLLASLHPIEKPVFDASTGDLISHSELTPRQLFHIRATFVCERMLMQLATAPTAQRMGQHPHAALHRPWDELPTTLRNLGKAAVGVLIAIAGTPSSRKADSERR